MKILVFPEALDNPYQKLLYASMHDEGDSIRYLSFATQIGAINALALIAQIFFWRLRGYQIFHLHWTNAFSSSNPSRFTYWKFLFYLKFIRVMGYKLVWTAHNALPHEKTFPDDIAAQRELVRATDLVIAHSSAAIEELQAIDAEPSRYVIIPHGSYLGAYPNTINRETARKRLGLAMNEFVYLYLGQIKEYKGVDNLLSAYENLSIYNAKLIIAGKAHDADVNRKLITLSESHRIILHEKYIDDNDLQIYFAAANVVVLPFKRITTSGSALLAISFGTAVIVPRLGDLAQLPDSVAYKYSPDDIDGLITAMKQAAADSQLLDKKTQSALQYAQELNWSDIGKKTHEAMQKLL